MSRSSLRTQTAANAAMTWNPWATINPASIVPRPGVEHNPSRPLEQNPAHPSRVTGRSVRVPGTRMDREGNPYYYPYIPAYGGYAYYPPYGYATYPYGYGYGYPAYPYAYGYGYPVAYTVPRRRHWGQHHHRHHRGDGKGPKPAPAPGGQQLNPGREENAWPYGYYGYGIPAPYYPWNYWWNTPYYYPTYPYGGYPWYGYGYPWWYGRFQTGKSGATLTGDSGGFGSGGASFSGGGGGGASFSGNPFNYGRAA